MTSLQHVDIVRVTSDVLQVLIVKASLLMFWIEGFGICHDCGSSIEDPNTIFVLRKKKIAS